VGGHRLLDWGWPGFLTDDFELVLIVGIAATGIAIIANLVKLVIGSEAGA